MIKIEFFHDVICSFCFPMSARMRKISEKYNNVEIIHRSFALGWEEENFIRMFGSREAVKPEVLGHWAQANQNDDDHRFDIEGMETQDFNFPISKPGLLAAKAAGLLGGQEAYWEVFDALQEALFVENKNIEDPQVIEEVIQGTDVDLEKWKEQVQQPETEEAVLADLKQAENYSVYSAPTLIINGKYRISGAQPLERIEQALEKAAIEEGISLNQLEDLTVDESGSCFIIDGKWECD